MNAATPYLQTLAAAPARAAIHEPGGRQINFSDLLRRIVAFAEHLRHLGLAPGDRVVLQVPNGIEFATTALGTLLAGGVPLLIEPGLGEQVYLSRVRAAAPKWLIVHPLIIWVNRLPGATRLLQRLELDVPPVPELPGMTRLIVDARRLDRIAAGPVDPATFQPAEREPGDDGILVFTGGTTSEPKGVRLSHGALGDYIAHISSAIADCAFENFLADTPQQVLYALRLGKTAYITKGRKEKRARHVRALIEAGAIDAYFGSPYVWTEMMARAGDRSGRLPQTLQTVLLGGAPVTAEFLAQLGQWLPTSTRTLVLYGMTEAGPVCAVSAEKKIAYEGHGDLVGAPLQDVRLEIAGANEHGIGEVIVHSPSLYTGYLGRPARAAGEGLATGDKGKLIDVDGTPMLVLLGRVKDMIIRNGVNIYPVSFEAALRAVTGQSGRPLLREAALIGLWNPERQDEDVVLCAAPTPGQVVSPETLHEHAARLCGTDAKPDHVLVLDAIPVTGRQNKVDKQALRRYASERLGLPLRGEESA
jgi:acyl-CoA synthetase (AMP-forming)/AMP-acid ligase II